jgi:hypothetical protein
LKHVPDDKVADGQGIGIGRKDDFDAAPAASRHVDILQTDATPAHNPKFGRAGKKRFVHFCIRANEQSFGNAEEFGELRVVKGNFRYLGPFAEPLKRLGIGTFGYQYDWAVCIRHKALIV